MLPAIASSGCADPWETFENCALIIYQIIRGEIDMRCGILTPSPPPGSGNRLTLTNTTRPPSIHIQTDRQTDSQADRQSGR
eukprot:362506-Chlamydomonas_euryale.AAC.2